jgi:hypothetical protein
VSNFKPAAAPNGGHCQTAGISCQTPAPAGRHALPSAGKYSPLLFKLTREDGTQRLGKIEATLPTFWPN